MEEWEISDDEMDAFVDEWRAIDREAAAYLAARIPGLTDPASHEDAWLDALVETFSPADEPAGPSDLFSAVMALQHVDWLGVAMGVATRGPGATLDVSAVLADIDTLDDIDGEIEDPEGTRQVLETALLALTPEWQRLGVLDEEERLTERGVWGLPRALHRNWSRA